MKKIIVTGSLAYDRIMHFSEKFSDHILPDQIHNLNVCFQVNGVTENFGGTAGNIAYALKLMGVDPVISATIGNDHHNYFAWLAKNHIGKEEIRIIAEELTASAYITTDTSNNQITGFNPGAMKYTSCLDIAAQNPAETLLLVSPGNLEDMITYPKLCKENGIPYIFDPGQALPMLQPKDLIEVITGAMMLIVNEYEFSLLQEKTALTREGLLALAEITIITSGAAGSQIHENGNIHQVPVYKTSKVADPTGAGDAYRGGLLSGLVEGLPLPEAALRGAVCASFAVECDGTQDYTISREAFLTRLVSLQ